MADVIKQNLKNLIDLNDLSYPPASAQIGIVYGYLTEDDNHDNGTGLFANLLFSALGLIGEIEAIPAAPVIAWFLSAVVNTFNEKTQPQLYSPFPQIAARYTATYMAIDDALTTILNDLDHHMDDVFTIPDYINLPPPYNNKKTITVRELASVTIPANYSDDFNTCKDRFIIGFRNELVKQELPRINKYGIGTIHKRDMGRYNIFVMTVPGSPNDTLYGWSTGRYTIDSNDIQLENHNVTVSGNKYSDFNATAGSYCEQMGGALIVPISNDGANIDYHKYYMFTGYETDEHSGWNLSSKDFYDWLFQDDGFGNVIRPDSVGKRNDIFRNWNITNGSCIPPPVVTRFVAHAYPEEEDDNDLFWACTIA